MDYITQNYFGTTFQQYKKVWVQNIAKKGDYFEENYLETHKNKCINMYYNYQIQIIPKIVVKAK